MKHRKTISRAVIAIGFLALIFGLSYAPASSAATGSGWIRFGNLSEAFGAVDIYISPAGGSGQQLEGSDLSYGTVLNPVAFSAGSYTVSIRKSGDAATAKPAATLAVTVKPGTFYLVAPLQVAGKGAARHVVALPDATSSSTGDSYVQAINASSQHGSITFHCSCAAGKAGNILTSVTSGTAASAKIPAGNWTMSAVGTDAKASQLVPLAAGTDRTEIVLDSGSGGNGAIEILNLLDTVAGQVATGAPATGFGGTAPHGPASPLPWLMATGAGVLLALGGGVSLGRAKRRSAAQPAERRPAGRA